MFGLFIIACVTSGMPGGIIFFAAGKLMQNYPPKWPNIWFGYRTQSSLKTKETFNAANAFSSALMIKYGLVMMGGSFLLAFLFQEKRWWLFCLLGLAFLITCVVALMVKTEKYLATHFDKSGKPIQ